MARRMLPLEAQFATEVNLALELADAGERIRAFYPPRSVARTELPISRLEAMYETAFLRIFRLWEDFLEQSFLRYLCGYESSMGVATLVNPRFRTIADAETAVLGTKGYVSWAKPASVTYRAAGYVVGGFHQAVISSNLARLDAFASVRNRIAHASTFARRHFDAATVALVGHRYPGSSAGSFLRDTAVSHPVPERWLHHVADELKSLANQICP